MIACDHHRRDARVPAGPHGGPGFGARRIHHADQADERHGPFRVGDGGLAPARNGQHAQPRGRHVALDRENRRAIGLLERGLTAVARPGRTVRQHHVHRSLGERGQRPLAILVQRRHAPPFGREGDLVPARERLVERALVEASFLGRNHERRLGGIALDPPGAVLVETHPGVGGEDRRAERVAHRVGRSDDLPVTAELADRVVADARDLHHAVRRGHAADRHLVARQGAGLVGTDRGGAPERLHHRQPADQRLALDHAAHANGQRDRHHRRQRFGHHRHGEGDAEDEHVEQGHATPDAERHDRADDEERRLGEDAAEPIEILLQRRPAGLHRVHQAGDAAELGVHARGHHHALPASASHQRAGVGHVALVGDRQIRVGEHAGHLLHGQRFAGERRFVDGEVHREPDADVGRYAVAGPQHDGVTRDEFPRRHLRLDTAPQRVRQWRRHLPQRFERTLGAVLLHEAEQDRKEHDDGDHHRFERVAHDPRHRRRGEQDQHQHVLELGHQRVPRRPRPGREQLVRAVLLQPPLCFRDGQAGLGRSERAIDIGELEGVPGAGRCRRRRSNRHRRAFGILVHHFRGYGAEHSIGK